MKFDIELGTINKARKFCDYALELNEDVYICQGRYIVDGKSIMGIFSLDFTERMQLQIDEPQDDFYEFFTKIKELGVICLD